jgi:hypothetical protein
MRLFVLFYVMFKFIYMLSYVDFIYTFLPLSHQVDTSHKITYLLRLQRHSNKKLWKQRDRKKIVTLNF